MQPSSLVFVVVIGLWAAYLTQSWMRRREHLQTARSIERYAEALRVLERRPVLAEPTTPRSYAVSPLRAGVTATAPAGATRATPVTEEAGPGRRARSLRGASLGIAVTALIALVMVTVLRLVPVWTPAVGLALVTADLAWLRHTARPRRPRLELHRTTSSAGRTDIAAPVEPAAPGASTAPTTSSVSTADALVVVDTAEPAVTRVGDIRVDAPFDVRQFDTVDEAPAPVEVVLEPLEPGQWRPTPVPPPTYTMKPAAPRAAPAPLPEDDDVFAPIEVEDEFLDAAVPLRSAVGG
ncbi:hypothetical protein [uncultured Arsenicicoccus sp.]|uniref:hypothetical protein n=1 Tax=uncultured Arsenicicoccus sp. TaxID=491339 RepID=UPI00259AE240|nr:hypothetical protein [uncultured Arsenicicoccus sp.]